MTVMPIPDLIEVIEDLLDTGSGHGHVACCIAVPKVFLCGAPYHPECDDDTAPDCARCVRMLEECKCAVGHQHCPVVLSPLIICPPKRKEQS